ncbi:hypothetical protein [Streptomyces sp. SID3212]|uniref:hypothetical protein n=1 Tax=Streptomyces sp. SID3212 TaxID=2690259 RepID=UPI00136ADC20|nr:hypothetical protein [Streptomyces sp. SID3212]MYV58032.1 hypothetical protein [Streptomyces sp. SID3212]
MLGLIQLPDIPDVLIGVLKENDYLESLKAIRNRLAEELSAGGCDHCGREGPRDSKDVAAITLRLVDVLGKIEAYENPQGGARAPEGGEPKPDNVFDLNRAQARVAEQQGRRTGHGTQTTSAPQSVAKRQDGYGRRPGAGRKPKEG